MSIKDMADGNDNLEVYLTRIEGKIDRQSDRLERYERDMQGIRQRLHDLSNDVTPIIMLDLPGRIRTADMVRADHDTRLKSIENLEQQRKGAAALGKVLWAILGAVGVGGIAAVLRVFQVGGL